MYRRRVVWAAAVPLLVLGLWSAAVTPAHAAAAVTLTVGVDNASPAGHNWEFSDFFPRAGINVHNGDTLHFVLNLASADGLHNVTLGTLGKSASQIAADNPTFAPDSGVGDADPAGSQRFNGFFGTNPPPGSGAPGACGDVTTPCTYNGTADINSGAMLSGGPFTQFYFKIQLPSAPVGSPTVVNYICTVHGAAMSGTFSIVPDASIASTQASLDAAAAVQYSGDVAAATAVETAVGNAAVTTNPDGTRTTSMVAGTETSDGRVQILEMLPQSVRVTAGDHVKWTAPSFHDPHTVTFPSGAGSNSVDPIPQLCDSATGPDTAVTAGPPTFGCAGPPNSPTGLEIGVVPQPQGPTSISSASTVSSSGVLAAGQAFTYTFPTQGTFLYQCRIHDHMTGQVLVAVTTPPTGLAGLAHGSSSLTLAFILLTLGGVVVLLALLLARRRTAS